MRGKAMTHYQRLLDRAQRETDPAKLDWLHRSIEKEKLKVMGKGNHYKC